MASPPTMGAAPANTYTQPGASGSVREDLANIIWRIDPDETPFVTSLPRVGGKQINTEWLLQTLNTAQDVPQPEGFTAVISPAVKPARLGNICQIFARTVAVSGTLRNVDIPGGEDEYNRQLVLRGLELKRDLELVATGNVVKTITDPRHMAGMVTWCNNCLIGAGRRGPPGSRARHRLRPHPGQREHRRAADLAGRRQANGRHHVGQHQELLRDARPRRHRQPDRGAEYRHRQPA